MRPFPDVEGGRWQVSRDGASQPLWSPDGRELFYRDLQGMLGAARVETSPTFRVVDTRALFYAGNFVGTPDHTTYTVAGDGLRFLFILPPELITEGRLVLVENLFTELGPRLERD